MQDLIVSKPTGNRGLASGKEGELAKRDPERTKKLRIAVRSLLESERMFPGNQSRLAEHFKISRQRVHQVVVEERQALLAKQERERALVG